MKIFTEKEFIEMVGSAPEQDDLERLNCPDAGKIGHSSCGYCVTNNRPKFMGHCIKCEKCKEN